MSERNFFAERKPPSIRGAHAPSRASCGAPAATTFREVIYVENQEIEFAMPEAALPAREGACAPRRRSRSSSRTQ